MTAEPAFSAARFAAHAERLRRTSLRELCAPDADRGFLQGEAAGLFVDASRARVDRAAWDALLACAPAVEAARDRMFAGEKVNATEGRAALHPLLRAGADPGGALAEDYAATARERERMLAFAQAAAGRWRTVINLGIGGSDLGPRLACEALPARPGAPAVRFASSLDPDELDAALAGCEPAATLFIAASKTFSTVETLANADAARRWLRDGGVAEGGLAAHFAAATAAPERARAAGIGPERIFEFRDWVGGRYSLWSTVGLPIALHAGREAFLRLLTGARAMDRHFREAPAAGNLPLMLALLTVWNHSCLGAASRAVLPYNHRLRTLPRYLQQLQMESLGKSVRIDGSPAEAPAPVVWGGPGNDGAHAFFQSLHQGAQTVPAELIIARPAPDDARARMLLAQCLAQLDLLAWGRRADEAEPAPGIAAAHYAHPGDRPGTLILLERLDAEHLGALLALYEHATCAAAALWDINAFDQFGVEHGKRLTTAVADALADPERPAPGHTLDGLVGRLRRPRGGDLRGYLGPGARVGRLDRP